MTTVIRKVVYEVNGKHYDDENEAKRASIEHQAVVALSEIVKPGISQSILSSGGQSLAKLLLDEPDKVIEILRRYRDAKNRMENPPVKKSKKIAA